MSGQRVELIMGDTENLDKLKRAINDFISEDGVARVISVKIVAVPVTKLLAVVLYEQFIPRSSLNHPAGEGQKLNSQRK